MTRVVFFLLFPNDTYTILSQFMRKNVALKLNMHVNLEKLHFHDYDSFVRIRIVTNFFHLYSIDCGRLLNGNRQKSNWTILSCVRFFTQSRGERKNEIGLEDEYEKQRISMGNLPFCSSFDNILTKMQVIRDSLFFTCFWKSKKLVIETIVLLGWFSLPFCNNEKIRYWSDLYLFLWCSLP